MSQGSTETAVTDLDQGGKEAAESKKGDSPAPLKVSQVNGAFEAFASSLLRLKGRVRFATISRVFREEFPSFASEDVLPNVTLGRSIQAWYETKTGKPLKKSRSGSYIGMSLINPHYTESDLTPLRTVQALYDKEMDKSFAKLGLNVVRSSAKSGGQAVKAKQERSEGKARKGKMLKGKDAGMSAGKSKRSAAPQDDRKEVKEILTYCVEAFANCRLTDQGNVTFRELYSEFIKNFPFAEKEPSFSEPHFGRILAKWYKAKFRNDLTRIELLDEDKRQLKRSMFPFANLGFNAEPVDPTLMNEAKVALRRVMKMEGVGIMVKKNSFREYEVATIIPGSPASIEGNVEKGDILLAVGGNAVVDMTPQELADAVLGPRGSKVSMTLKRAAVQQTSSGGQVLERVYTVELVRSDRKVEGSKMTELEIAERYRDKLVGGSRTS